MPDTDWDAPVDSTTTRDRISATTSTSLSAIGNWWSGKSSASGNSTNADTATKTHMSLTCPPVVLFYCACLISTTPGTVYVTCDRVYIQYGVGFLTPTKIVFPLSTISNCASDPTASLPTLLIHIVNRSKTISVTPLAVECSVLKDVIYSLLLHYHNES